MIKTYNNDGQRLYKHNCPISIYNQWPPSDPDWEGLSIWNSLDASPEKMASYHGYNHAAIMEALDAWDNRGSGLLVSVDERLSFMREVQLICDEERQGWTFKRTAIIVNGIKGGYESEDFLSDSESS